MATTFEGWLASWGDSWGPQVFDPNAVSGTAGIVLSAFGTIEGIYIGPTPPDGDSCGWFDRRRVRVIRRKKRENDEALLMFVL